MLGRALVVASLVIQSHLCLTPTLVAVSEQVAKLQEEGRKFEERSAKGGGQDDNADRNFFLEEVNRLQREFMDSQDIPVKDTQLKALRTKWRNEAYEALKQRKEDKNFFERQT